MKLERKLFCLQKTSTTILNQVRLMWDSTRSIARTINDNVGDIGNALRLNGVVSDDVYGQMATGFIAGHPVAQKLDEFRGASQAATEILDPIADLPGRSQRLPRI